MNESELKELCALWQKRLRLQDWNIRLVVKSAEDMEDDFARVFSQLSTKCAVMHIRKMDDINSVDVRMSGERDIEDDVVHELLHLTCEPFTPEDRESHEYEAIEQAVGVLANCIVGLSRER